MPRLADVMSVLLLLGSVVAFVLGFLALGDRRDLGAVYWLVVGGLSLRAATNLLRPKAGAR